MGSYRSNSRLKECKLCSKEFIAESHKVNYCKDCQDIPAHRRLRILSSIRGYKKRSYTLHTQKLAEVTKCVKRLSTEDWRELKQMWLDTWE